MVVDMHDAPALETYTDLVDRHLERLYRFLVLMIGERDLAEADTLAAYRRVWTDLQAGNVFGDAEEILYRTATRSALRRRQRGSVHRAGAQ